MDFLDLESESVNSSCESDCVSDCEEIDFSCCEKSGEKISYFDESIENRFFISDSDVESDEDAYESSFIDDRDETDKSFSSSDISSDVENIGMKKMSREAARKFFASDTESVNIFQKIKVTNKK